MCSLPLGLGHLKVQGNQPRLFGSDWCLFVLLFEPLFIWEHILPLPKSFIGSHCPQDKVQSLESS